MSKAGPVSGKLSMPIISCACQIAPVVSQNTAIDLKEACQKSCE